MKDDPRYPIGKFKYQGPPSEAERRQMITDIEQTPALLRSAIAGLSAQQLDTPYRDGGWTVREVIHHIPDSHINAYVRFKLALTEQDPIIKPYAEDLWAKSVDNQITPVEISLTLLDALHARWVYLLSSLGSEHWKRSFRHPEFEKPVSLERNLAIYSWHGKHHVAHITELRKRMAWQ